MIVFIHLYQSYSKRRLGLTLGPSVDRDTELNHIHCIRYFGVIGDDIFVVSALSHALLIPLHDVPEVQLGCVWTVVVCKWPGAG